MSQADIEKFVSDLKSNPDLLDQVRQGAGGLQSVVDLAKSKGYDVNLDEAKAYIHDQAGQTLSDDQLDAVAGGKGHHHSTSVASIQSVVTTTTEATTAETTATVIAEAEVVIVLT